MSLQQSPSALPLIESTKVNVELGGGKILKNVTLLKAADSFTEKYYQGDWSTTSLRYPKERIDNPEKLKVQLTRWKDDNISITKESGEKLDQWQKKRRDIAKEIHNQLDQWKVGRPDIAEEVLKPLKRWQMEKNISEELNKWNNKEIPFPVDTFNNLKGIPIYLRKKWSKWKKDNIDIPQELETLMIKCKEDNRNISEDLYKQLEISATIQERISTNEGKLAEINILECLELGLSQTTALLHGYDRGMFNKFIGERKGKNQEFDFFVIFGEFQKFVHVEVKSDCKGGGAIDQLKKGKQFWNEVRTALGDDEYKDWGYIPVLALPNAENKDKVAVNQVCSPGLHIITKANIKKSLEEQLGLDKEPKKCIDESYKKLVQVLLASAHCANLKTDSKLSLSLSSPAQKLGVEAKKQLVIGDSFIGPGDTEITKKYKRDPMETLIFWNKDQLRFRDHCAEEKCILSGTFGSGKTLIVLEKLKILLERGEKVLVISCLLPWEKVSTIYELMMRQKILRENDDQKENDQEKIDSENSDQEKIDSKISDQEKIYPKNSDQEKIDPKNSDQEKIDLENSDQEKIDPENSDQEKIDPQNSDQEKIDPKNSDQEKIDPKNSDQEKIGPKNSEQENTEQERVRCIFYSAQEICKKQNVAVTEADFYSVLNQFIKEMQEGKEKISAVLIDEFGDSMMKTYIQQKKNMNMDILLSVTNSLSKTVRSNLLISLHPHCKICIASLENIQGYTCIQLNTVMRNTEVIVEYDQAMQEKLNSSERKTTAVLGPSPFYINNSGENFYADTMAKVCEKDKKFVLIPNSDNIDGIDCLKVKAELKKLDIKVYEYLKKDDEDILNEFLLAEEGCLITNYKCMRGVECTTLLVYIDDRYDDVDSRLLRASTNLIVASLKEGIPFREYPDTEHKRLEGSVKDPLLYSRIVELLLERAKEYIFVIDTLGHTPRKLLIEALKKKNQEPPIEFRNANTSIEEIQNALIPPKRRMNGVICWIGCVREEQLRSLAEGKLLICMYQDSNPHKYSQPGFFIKVDYKDA